MRGCGEATRGGSLYYPIFLAYATGVLEKFGHEVRLVDAQAEKLTPEDIESDVSQFGPEIIVIDTNFSSLNNDIEVAIRLKHLNDAILIFVGPPVSQFSNLILNCGVDFTIKYEYECTLVNLVHSIENNLPLSSIRGISYKVSDDIIDSLQPEFMLQDQLDKLPFVSKVYKEHLNIHDYFISSSFYPMVQILTGRGCPNRCTFCSWPKTFMGNEYRSRSVENVLDEFEYVENELPLVKEIFLEDDTFTLDKKRVSNFCEGYNDRDLSITWSCNSRANLDYSTLAKMKKANCRLLIVGFESGDKLILKNIKKNINIENAKLFVKNAKKAGLLIHGDFIIGLPGETHETIKTTKKFINTIKPHILQVLIPQPIPGTYLYEWAKGEGFLLTADPNEYLDERGYMKSVISYPNLSNDEILFESNKILKEYYLSFHYIPLALVQVMRKNGYYELRRIVHCSKEFLKYIR